MQRSCKMLSFGNCKWSERMPVSNENESSDMELINIEHHNIHNDTLMVPRAPKSEILIKRMT